MADTTKRIGSPNSLEESRLDSKGSGDENNGAAEEDRRNSTSSAASEKRKSEEHETETTKKQKTSFSFNKPIGLSPKLNLKTAAPISIKLGAQKVKEPTKPIAKTITGAVAKAFNADDDEDEEEEMPPEAKMRMRNIGRDTPTSAGPNSFGKTKFGFCDSRKMFGKETTSKNKTDNNKNNNNSNNNK